MGDERMSDHRYTDTCANCGHDRYHHNPDCGWMEWPSLGFPRKSWCDCEAFVEQAGENR